MFDSKLMISSWGPTVNDPSENEELRNISLDHADNVPIFIVMHDQKGVRGEAFAAKMKRYHAPAPQLSISKRTYL